MKNKEKINCNKKKKSMTQEEKIQKSSSESMKELQNQASMVFKCTNDKYRTKRKCKIKNY